MCVSRGKGWCAAPRPKPTAPTEMRYAFPSVIPFAHSSLIEPAWYGGGSIVEPAMYHEGWRNDAITQRPASTLAP